MSGVVFLVGGTFVVGVNILDFSVGCWMYAVYVWCMWCPARIV